MSNMKHSVQQLTINNRKRSEPILRRSVYIYILGI